MRGLTGRAACLGNNGSEDLTRTREMRDRGSELDSDEEAWESGRSLGQGVRMRGGGHRVVVQEGGPHLSAGIVLELLFLWKCQRKLISSVFAYALRLQQTRQQGVAVLLETSRYRS